MTPPRPPHIPDRIVWIDGRLARGAEAVVSVFDRGVHDGERLFETLRVHARRPCDWQRHLEGIGLLDGPLHELPFAALVRQQASGQQYLVEWKPLHTTTSMSVYAETLHSRRAANPRERLSSGPAVPLSAAPRPPSQPEPSTES